MKLVRATLFAALALCTPAAILAQAPSDLASASKLSPDAGKSDSWTYRNPDVALSKYQRFLIQPTVVYADPAAQWGSTTPEQRQKYADYMTRALRNAIAEGYQIADRPGPGVATMRLTLLGVQKTIGRSRHRVADHADGICAEWHSESQREKGIHDRLGPCGP